MNAPATTPAVGAGPRDEAILVHGTAATRPRGRGMIDHQLRDPVQIRSPRAGTVVRVRTRGTEAPAR